MINPDKLRHRPVSIVSSPDGGSHPGILLRLIQKYDLKRLFSKIDRLFMPVNPERLTLFNYVDLTGYVIITMVSKEWSRKYETERPHRDDFLSFE
jgi:hypothetical protein